MLLSRLKRFATAVAAIAAVSLAANRAEAAIEIIASTGGSSAVYYTSNNNVGATGIFNLGGYNTQIDTTITSFDGTSSGTGDISTTINIRTIAAGSPPLTVTILLIANNATLDALPAFTQLNAAQTAIAAGQALLTWAAPTQKTVNVLATVSSSTPITAGNATTDTYFNSPGVTGTPRTTETGGAVPGTLVTNSGSINLANVAALSNTKSASNPGVGYTLSQQVTISNASATTLTNVNADSKVTGGVVPEPSSVTIALLSTVGFVGYGLRRRRALGA
jgi:hypothetical protein